MNLIPEAHGFHGDYWCTWCTQSAVVNTELPEPMRDRIDEDFLFGSIGVLTKYMDRVRGDLVIVLDDGWDVCLGSSNPATLERFGSLELDEGKFPSFTGSPAERLKKLNEKVKSLGYLGIGLWVSPQRVGETGQNRFTDDPRPYWEERARWSEYAGVLYWKVDWGTHCNEADYLEMLADCVHRCAPHVAIEIDFCRFPLDRPEDYYHDKMELMARTMKAGDYYRTYDNMAQLGNVITLARIAHLGVCACESGSVPSVEDNMYLAGGLGCAVGVMRHPLAALTNSIVSPFEEAERLLRWHRIAPPEPLRAGELTASDEILTDTHLFEGPKDAWPYINGTEWSQSAPAAMARNGALPKVTPRGGEKPFAVFCRSSGGACSTAVLPRTRVGKMNYLPEAELRLECGIDKPLAVFGRVASLEIASAPESGKRVLIQDLASDEAVDITQSVTRKDGALVIPGALFPSDGVVITAVDA